MKNSKYNNHTQKLKASNNKRKYEDGARIRLREFKPYLYICAWITNNKNNLGHFQILSERMSKLIKNNGWVFSFQYMKRCLSLVIGYISHSETFDSSFKLGQISVRVDYSGLPVIIPWDLRQYIRGWSFNKDDLWGSARNIKELSGLLSMLSIYRLFPWKPKVDLSTIQDEHNGEILSISKSAIKRSVLDLFNISNIKHLRFKVKKPKLIHNESAGPNNKKSIWGAEIDAISFIHDYRGLKLILSGFARQMSFTLLIWFTVLIILGLPYYLVSLALGASRSVINRLSVVYKVSGKARVIGISNYWIQVLFKPLHDELFKHISSLKTDGTFDQHKPLKELLKRKGNSKYYSFDLSAATDRLPLQIQEDILSCLGYDSKIWAGIMRLPYFYKGKDIYYSVGQPMGAYSSWAMLALTHHVIIRHCALSVGLKQFEDYCVLGDDVVICNDNVAAKYLEIFKSLGVNINLSKSLISSTFVEFAKRWMLPIESHWKDLPTSLDVSPIGPGLILQAIRSRSLCFDLFKDLADRGMFSFEYLIKSLSTAPKVLNRNILSAIFGSIINNFNYAKLEASNVKTIEDLSQAFPDIMKNKVLSTKGSFFLIALLKRRFDKLDSFLKLNEIFDSLILFCEEKADREYIHLVKDVKSFFLKGYKTTQMRVGLPYLFDLILFPLKPAVWLLTRNFFDRYKFIKIKRELIVKLKEEFESTNCPDNINSNAHLLVCCHALALDANILFAENKDSKVVLPEVRVFSKLYKRSLELNIVKKNGVVIKNDHYFMLTELYSEHYAEYNFMKMVFGSF